MTSDGISEEQAGLRRATLMGTVAGLRSQMPLGILARAIDHDEVTPPSGPLGTLLRSPQGRRILKIAALGEAIADKTPFVPTRHSPKPLLGRITFGALAAATLAQTQGTPTVPAALRGAAGAGIGSVAGYAFRIIAGRVTGLPNLVVALAEDAIAIGLARSAIQPDALAKLAAEMDAAPAPAPHPDPAPTPATLASQPAASTAGTDPTTEIPTWPDPTEQPAPDQPAPQEHNTPV